MESCAAAHQTGSWTNEKHVHFLNSMEASFVRAMFENNTGIHRLDRYLPDSSESTLDLKARRREKHASPGSGRGRMDGRADKRARRRVSSHPWNPPSQDQVVPQVESKTGSDHKD
ncbi:uncharacterized protein LOC133861459 isoform X2 [Alnus glutinosa]|uniref:uncharacterized protein LOC133861459 isoform X2 n=1 Tax=Alnus glutinosa TaxID=3517 RepID=UPI002D78F1CB|nr:uncharacterized protein LOC133861459 isoform X2 [Alnus glutinosa]